MDSLRLALLYALRFEGSTKGDMEKVERILVSRGHPDTDRKVCDRPDHPIHVLCVWVSSPVLPIDVLCTCTPGQLSFLGSSAVERSV